MNKPPTFIKPVSTSVSPDKLVELASLARQAKMLASDIERLEELLRKTRNEYNAIVTESLPDVMDDIGVTKLSFNDPSTNEPVDVKWAPYYHASIEASWDEERRKKAFAYLEKLGEGDLIKTNVVISFPREDRKKAIKLIDELNKRKINAEIKEQVHHMTLTAWLRKEIEDRHLTPDLTTIGAVVGRKAVIK